MNTMPYQSISRSVSTLSCSRIRQIRDFLRYALLLSIVGLPATSIGAPPAPPSGLCIGTVGSIGCTPTVLPPVVSQPPPSTNSGNAVKWHPGHYMKLYRAAPQSNFDIILNEPNVKGVHVEYEWRNLEPQEGVYDFSTIESDLAYLQANGKRLIIRINDRAFSLSYKATPAYLETNPIYKGGIAPTKNGTIARIWDPLVMDRMILLYQQLGARFNAEPYIEGIAPQETTPGFAGNFPPDYTRSAHAAQLKRAIAAFRAAFPNTVVFETANFLSGQIPGIIANAYQVGAGRLGPDLNVGDKNGGSTAQLLTASSYAGKMPIADIVSAPVLCGRSSTGPLSVMGKTKKCYLPEDILNYGVNDIKDNYILWVRYGTNEDTPTYKFSMQYGIIPIINKYNGKINAACPTNISICNTQ